MNEQEYWKNQEEKERILYPPEKFIDFTDNLERKIPFLIILFTIVYAGWRLFSLTSMDNLLEYYSNAPMLFRIQTQILIQMDGIIFSFYTWNALIFLLVFIIIFLLIDDERDCFFLILFLSLMLIQPNFADSLQYLFLFSLIKTNNSWYALPLILIKEFTFYIAIIYLILKKRQYEIVLFIGLLYYIQIRIVGLLYWNIEKEVYIKLLEPFFYLFVRPFYFIEFIIIMTIFLYLYINTQDKTFFKILFVLNLIPILIFGNFWEWQLYGPLFLILLLEKESKEE